MRQIEDKLSLFVKEQFPAFYNEEGEMFQIFLKAYYEYLEQENQTLDYSRNLLEYLDIDKTTEEFLEHYKSTFLTQLPGLIKADDRLTIKNIMDFYRAKGTPRAVQLLFRLIFDETIRTDYPSEDVLKPSTSRYKLPKYIEVYTGNLDKLIELEGLEVVGDTSGAKAFVESISTKVLNSVKVYCVKLSNLRGNFLRGEIIAKSSDGVTDDMPIVTGSLSDIEVTLGGSDFVVGDQFDVIALSGKQGQARVTAVADATGLVDFELANGGFGFSKDGNVTFTDVNDQNLTVGNVINAAQAYSNTFTGNTHANGDLNVAAPFDSIINKIDDAEFFRFETVRQDVESVSISLSTNFNANLQKYNSNALNTELPTVQGALANGDIVANGYIFESSGGTGTNTLKVAMVSGSFGNQVTSTINLASNSHTFEVNESVDEESSATLTVFNNSSANLEVIFSTSDVVEGTSSGANGIVAGITNSTVMTVNGIFGIFTSNDNIFVSGAPGTSANLTDINITSSGANGIVSTANTSEIVINDVVGAFNDDLKIKGRRSNALAVTNTVSNTGASDVHFNQNTSVTAPISSTSNISITATVIGSNATNIGFKNTRTASGSTATFHNSAAAFIRGDVSNTHANVLGVGTGTGADFSIGSLENEDPITIYTDFVGENNVSNVSYLDCVIDGGNSGIGFLDTVSIDTPGTGYSQGETITFNDGGPGNGPPSGLAIGTISSVGSSGEILGVTVSNNGSGYFTSATATMPSTTGDAAAVTGNFDFGYGFPKDQDGDFTTILDNVFTRISGNVGTITALSSINPGNNYSHDPYISVYTPGIAKFDKRDIVLNLTNMANTSGGAFLDFIIGETVNQTITFTSQVLTVNPTTGTKHYIKTFNNGSANAVASNTDIQNLIGHTVSQVTQVASGGNGNTSITTLGEILSGNSSSIVARNLRVKTDANGAVSFTTPSNPFTNSSVGANVTIGDPSVADSNISGIVGVLTTIGTVAQSQTAKGQVYKFTNNNDGTGEVGLRRLSFSVGFDSSNTISGTTSTAGGTIDSIYEDDATRPIGDNANVIGDAKAANGIVTAVEVIDSGFGYQHNASLTLRSTNTQNQIVVSGTANVSTTGVGPGYWESRESFLNTKYIHDNDFYQSHSYVIESGLSLNKYRDILLQTTHIAGTRLFGRVFKESVANVALTVSNNQIQRLRSSNSEILQTVNT